ncbi:putative member of the Sir2 family of NAD(+)-dependent protein deacetylase, partial [Fistulina hepatica ATCC 64428]
MQSLILDGGDASTRRNLTTVSRSVVNSRKIVVVTGAGISCSCGIPDFRSSDGLYNLVKQQYPNVVMKGRDLFDASLFRDPTSTAIFYTFISKLKQSIDKVQPSETHKFLYTLEKHKRLLRSYTQNIDGLEGKVGLVSSSAGASNTSKGKGKVNPKVMRNVQLHGDIHAVRCMSCSAEFPCTSEHLSLFNGGTPPDCPECLKRCAARIARSARPLKVGSLRPAIVLYDEPHPLGDVIGTIESIDLARRPDCLIVMGTSLKVHGLKKLVKEFARTIHTSAALSSNAKKGTGKVIFVNRTPPSAEWGSVFDYYVSGETDAWVMRVLKDWKSMRPQDWETQQTL